MHVIRLNRTAWSLVALIAVAGHAAAASVWTAELDVEEEMEAYTIRIVAASEEDCLAQMSTYRGAVVIEPCHPAPTASAITDPNDANRTSKTPKPKKVADGGGGGGW
ncbi:MAG: hypothetical protein WAZ48_07990 [Lysobacteraceae bacterium]